MWLIISCYDPMNCKMLKPSHHILFIDLSRLFKYTRLIEVRDYLDILQA